MFVNDLFSWQRQDNDELKKICDNKNYDEVYVLFSLTRKDKTKMKVVNSRTFKIREEQNDQLFSEKY